MNAEPEGSDLPEDGSETTSRKVSLLSAKSWGREELQGGNEPVLPGSCLPPQPPPVYHSTALPEGSVHAQGTLFNSLAVISVLEPFISPNAYLMPEW